MGDLGPEVPLPSRAEAILRDIDAVNQIGEGAVRAGGFKRFLEDAEDAGGPTDKNCGGLKGFLFKPLCGEMIQFESLYYFSIC